VAYKLDLPPTSKVHPVSHVSLLLERISELGYWSKPHCLILVLMASCNLNLLLSAYLGQKNGKEGMGR